MKVEAADIVGLVGGKAGRPKEIGVEFVLAGDLIALAEDCAAVSTGSKLCGVTCADIRARAGFDAVVAGELVEIEEERIIEDEAQSIFVGNFLLIARRIGPRDDLADRLDHG